MGTTVIRQKTLATPASIAPYLFYILETGWWLITIKGVLDERRFVRVERSGKQPLIVPLNHGRMQGFGVFDVTGSVVNQPVGIYVKQDGTVYDTEQQSIVSECCEIWLERGDRVSVTTDLGAPVASNVGYAMLNTLHKPVVYYAIEPDIV